MQLAGPVLTQYALRHIARESEDAHANPTT
jgi:hypothetical protein